MRRAILFFLALYTIFAQPNLPACWLEQKACASHPHPFHDEDIPHSHDYLFDMILAGTAAALPSVSIPAAILLALIGSTAVFYPIRNRTLVVVTWSPLVPEPPPRFSLPA